MNNGEVEIRRGDVFWVKMGDAIGSEQTMARPGVVINSDTGIETSDVVTILFLTTKYKPLVDIHIETNATGKTSWVLCEQVMTVSKLRLGGYMGTLTEDELEAVDRGFCIAHGLNPQPKDDPEKLEMAKKIAVMKQQIEAHEEAKTVETVERDMYKKLYERALDELCALKMGRDMATRVVAPAPEVEKEEEPPVVEPTPAPEPELVDINSCNGATLRNIGCMPGQIKEIIDNRPYKRVEDLKSLRMMNKITWAFIKHKIYCAPVAQPEKKVEVVEKKVAAKTVVTPPAPAKPERVNVNTATVEEMVEIVGLSEGTAKAIRAYRNKHGKFVSLEDLLNVPRFGKVCLKKYSPKLEV